MTQILTLNEVDGIHSWPDCPSNAPHPYLRNPHRHRFVVECQFDVCGENREREIFGVQDEVDAFVANSYPHADALVDFGARSCEMIAREIAEALRASVCTVREDGRGGARYVRQ